MSGNLNLGQFWGDFLMILLNCPPAERVLRDAPVLPLQAQPLPRHVEDDRRREGHRRDGAVAHQHPGEKNEIAYYFS